MTSLALWMLPLTLVLAGCSKPPAPSPPQTPIPVQAPKGTTYKSVYVSCNVEVGSYGFELWKNPDGTYFCKPITEPPKEAR